MAIAGAILKLIIQLLGIWTGLHERDISVQQLSAAMTNMVFIVTVNASISPDPFEESAEKLALEPESLLLRVYGRETWMFNREMEEKVASRLAMTGVIPAWHGVFGNGRIEEYLPNDHVSAVAFRSPPFQSKIVPRLASIHESLPAVLEATGWDAIDQYWDRLDLWISKSQDAFLSFVENKNLLDDEHRQMFDEIASGNPFDSTTWSELKAAAMSTASPLVFGHCDVGIFFLFSFSVPNPSRYSCIMKMFFKS